MFYGMFVIWAVRMMAMTTISRQRLHRGWSVCVCVGGGGGLRGAG